MAKIYKDSVGVIFRIDTDFTLTGASLIQLKVKIAKTDNTFAYKTWPGAIYGTDTITYTTVAGDLDVAGRYYIQPYVEVAGVKYYGETVEEYVYEPWE